MFWQFFIESWLHPSTIQLGALGLCKLLSQGHPSVFCVPSNWKVRNMSQRKEYAKDTKHPTFVLYVPANHSAYIMSMPLLVSFQRPALPGQETGVETRTYTRTLTKHVRI